MLVGLNTAGSLVVVSSETKYLYWAILDGSTVLKTGTGGEAKKNSGF